MSIATLGLSQAINLLSALVRVPWAIEYLGGFRFGLMTTVLSVVPWIATITGGSRIATRARIGAIHAEGRPTQLSAILRTARKIGCQIAVAVVVLLVAGYLLLDKFAKVPLTGSEVVGLAIVLAVYGGFTPILGVGTGYRDTLGQHNRNVFATIAANVVAVPATYFVVAEHGPLWQLVLIGSLTNWAPGLAALPTLMRHRSVASKTEDASGFATGVWHGSGQGIGTLLSTGFDILLISAIRGFVAAGDYSLTSRLVIPVLMPSAALAPMQFRRLASEFAGEKSNVKFSFEVRRTVLVNTAITTVFGVIVFCVYRPLFAMMAGNAYLPNDTLAASCIVASVLAATFSSFFHGFGVPCALKMTRNIAVVVGVLNLALSVFATTLFGLYGPAVGSGIAYLAGISYWLVFLHGRGIKQLRTT